MEILPCNHLCFTEKSFYCFLSFFVSVCWRLGEGVDRQFFPVLGLETGCWPMPYVSICGIVLLASTPLLNVVSFLQVPELPKESIKRAPNRHAVAVLEKTITIQGKVK